MTSNSSKLYVLLFVNLSASLALSYVGVWYLTFLPSVILGFLLKSKWMNLVYFGFSGAVGAILPIFIAEVTLRLESGAVLAAIIGLPGGVTGPLMITALIAFLASGLAAVGSSSIRDFS